MNYLLLLSFAVFGLISDKELKHYTLNAPDKILSLPDSLREISGIAFINDSTVACIQDENGILFTYDLKNNAIKHRHPFHADGDYEGIAIVNNFIYVLRSDGKLFELSDYNSKKLKTKIYNTNVPAENNEGLCYNYASKELLIGCKNKTTDLDAEKNARQIYGYDLQKNVLSQQPRYALTVDDAMEYARKKNLDMGNIGANKKGKNKGAFKFNISAIAIHPFTGNLYILNAADHAIFVVNQKSNIEQIKLLDPLLFNKPEGISFTPNGDMYITNEGQQGAATILYFKYR